MDGSTTVYVHERIERDGACAWDVIVEGKVLLYTQDFSALEHLEHLLGIDRIVWVVPS